MSSLMPAGEQEGELVRVADDDQTAGAGVEDVVDPLAQRGAGGDHLQRLDEPGLLARSEISSRLFPGTWRHTDAILPGLPVFFGVAGRNCSSGLRRNPRLAAERRCSGAPRPAVHAAERSRARERPQRRAQRCRGLRRDDRAPRPNLRASATRRSAWRDRRAARRSARPRRSRRAAAVLRAPAAGGEPVSVTPRAALATASATARSAPGLVHAHAADDVDEHVRRPDADAAVARQHGEHEREAVAVDPVDDAPRGHELRLARRAPAPRRAAAAIPPSRRARRCRARASPRRRSAPRRRAPRRGRRRASRTRPPRSSRRSGSSARAACGRCARARPRTAARSRRGARARAGRRARPPSSRGRPAAPRCRAAWRRA